MWGGEHRPPKWTGRAGANRGQAQSGAGRLCLHSESFLAAGPARSGGVLPASTRTFACTSFTRRQMRRVVAGPLCASLVAASIAGVHCLEALPDSGLEPCMQGMHWPQSLCLAETATRASCSLFRRHCSQMALTEHRHTLRLRVGPGWRHRSRRGSICAPSWLLCLLKVGCHEHIVDAVIPKHITAHLNVLPGSKLPAQHPAAAVARWCQHPPIRLHAQGTRRQGSTCMASHKLQWCQKPHACQQEKD